MRNVKIYILGFILFQGISISSYAQFFVGQIVYETTHSSLKPKLISSEDINVKLGKEEAFCIDKNGKIKIRYNGQELVKKVFLPDSLKTFHFNRTDTVYWYDVTSPSSMEITLVKHTINSDTINGIICNKAVFKNKMGSNTYYYNPTLLKLDTSILKLNKFEKWDSIYSTVSSVPIKIDAKIGFIETTKTISSIKFIEPEKENFLISEHFFLLMGVQW